MDAKLVSFGEIEIDGRRFAHDVVVEGGKVRSAARDRRRSTVLATVTPVVGRGSDPLVGCAACYRDRRIRPAAGNGRGLRRGRAPRRRDRRFPD